MADQAATVQLPRHASASGYQRLYLAGPRKGGRAGISLYRCACRGPCADKIAATKIACAEARRDMNLPARLVAGGA